MWLCCSPFIIYILITLLSIPPNRLPSPPLQADSALPLPAREINERKQTIIRELLLSFAVKSMLKTSLFGLLNSSQMDTKSEQRKLLKVLCLQGLHGTPRARMREEKSGEIRPGLYERERERERERVQNYLELPNNLQYFFRLFCSQYLMIQQQTLHNQHLYYIRRCSLWF